MPIRCPIYLFLLLACLATPVIGAEENLPGMPDIQDFIEENIDAEALSGIASADQGVVTNALQSILRQFQSDYVIDVAELKKTATTVLPLLEQWEETYPYAIWLKTRMDYFDVAAELKAAQTNASPRTLTNGVAPLPWAPAPQQERELWIKKVSKKPWPPKSVPLITALKPVFRTERIPPELVWIAEVESSFDARARSPAGAAGLFQLMPATAKRFGLRTWPMDQRYSPEKSARAAAQYLRFLYTKFGDWRLALAAYNCGEGTVQKAQAKSKNASFDSIAARLPAETQLYVPKVEATLLKREGLRVKDLRVPGQ